MAVVKAFARRQPTESPWLAWLRDHLRRRFPSDADEREFQIRSTIDRYAHKGKTVDAKDAFRARIEQALKDVAAMPEWDARRMEILTNTLTNARTIHDAHGQLVKVLGAAIQRAEVWHRGLSDDHVDDLDPVVRATLDDQTLRSMQKIANATSPAARTTRILRRLRSDIEREAFEPEDDFWRPFHARGYRRPQAGSPRHALLQRSRARLRKAGVTNDDDRKDLVRALMQDDWSERR